MSKISQLHAELSEQAYELGYLTLDQALADGYEVDYRTSRLERPVDGREQAHNDWLKRKEGVLLDLETLKNNINTTLDRAIDFIKKGEI